jgi:hypothetical protein
MLKKRAAAAHDVEPKDDINIAAETL